MPISGKLLADFSSFYDAVQRATIELASFETGAGKVESALQRMTTNFSGKNAIQQATLMTQAVENIGGVANLTEAELKKVERATGEAIDKMLRMGVEVPPAMQKVHDEAKKLTAPLEESKKKTEELGGTIAKTSDESKGWFDKLAGSVQSF